MNLVSSAVFRRYRFEGHVLDTRTRELLGASGEVLPLTSKAFDTLSLLLEQRHRVVGKEELLASVWAGRVVEENNLTQAIAALRRAFGTGGNDHRYIVTVPGRGYRFVAEVEADEAAAAQATRPAWPPAAHSPARRALAAGALLFGLALFAIAAWRLQAPPRPPPAAPGLRPMPTLAVLPFRSLSPGPRDALLELGLADTLVTRLGRAEGLRVHPLASSQRPDAATDPLAAGRVLGAAYVVEGSAQRIGEQLRVNARLLAVADGATLWAGTFDARRDEVFTLQDRMGEAITSALEVGPAAAARVVAPCDGGDAQAYRALLRAQDALQRRAPGTIGAFREAIRRDPACARAYAGLAVAHMFMAHNDRPPRDVFPLAQAAAARALSLDPDAAEAHMAQGRYLQLHAWDWKASEAAHRRALAVNPSLADAHFALAHLLVTTGRFEEGLAQMRQARELDPLSPLTNALEAGFLGAAGQPAAAQARIARALELEPDFWIALLVRGGLALDRGDNAAAVADLERAAAQSRRTSQVLAVLAFAYVADGRRAQAEALLAELGQRADSGYVPPVNLAAVHLALGDEAAALHALERAHAARDIRIAFLGVDARWNALRGHPRFRALARRLQLPEGVARGRF